MRTPCPVWGALALAACGGQAASGNQADASPLVDATSAPDTSGDGEASVCASAALGAPTSYSTAYPPSGLVVYSPSGGVPNVIALEPGAPPPSLELLVNLGNGSFAPGTFEGSTGQDFYDAVTADFDGDGLADIASENAIRGDGGLEGALQIDRGTGGGAFATQLTTYPIPQSSGSLAAGDFNKDGHLDVAIAGATLMPRSDGVNVVASGLDVFLNDGRGSFGSPVTYPDNQGDLLDSIAAGDFDGDGSLDLALFPDGLFLNTGTGTFRAELPLPALPGDAGPSFVPYWAVGDFNRDGKSDLVASVGPTEIAVLLAVGGGSFAPAVTYDTSSTPSVVAVGDFNGDSYPDVAMLLDEETASSSLTLRMNQHDGTLGAEITVAVGPYAASLYVADFNGDGVADVAVTNDGFYAPDGGGPSSFTVVLFECR
jgi:hypothetical protein